MEEWEEDSIQKPLSDGDLLIQELELLRQYLLTLSDRLNKSGIERTHYMRGHKGADCGYFKKSMDLFLDFDYDEVRTLINTVYERFETIEGTHGGKPPKQSKDPYAAVT
jgi:hypothetical protein